MTILLWLAILLVAIVIVGALARWANYVETTAWREQIGSDDDT